MFADLNFTVQRCSEAAQSSDHLVEIGNDEIEVHGGPMPSEIAWHLCRAKLCDSWSVAEEEDWQISTCKLDPTRAELPFERDPEPATIEFDTAGEISYLDLRMNNEQQPPRFF